MLKNIFLIVEYVGTNYFGFQLQEKPKVYEPTIQLKIEEALAKLFKKDIRITYSSRTDRGVHAYGQAINFKVESNIPLLNIKRALNIYLPPDIRVKSVKIVPLDFHSRFSAKSKLYRYIIFNSPEPSAFEHDFSWHINRPLDIKAMAKAAKYLIGKKDFGVFAKDAGSYHDCVRQVKKIQIRERGKKVVIEIEANGFLRYMVRNIAAYFGEVGLGRISASKTKQILAKDIFYRNKPAPSAGLYLVKVYY
jgi:tRNA pseudouridine38-40 synthase